MNFFVLLNQTSFMRRLLFIFIIFLVGCRSHYTDAVMLLAPKGYTENLSDSIQLVDVRTPEEFAEGHIQHAVNINFHDEDFSSQIAELNKKRPVYVYCRSGKRSGKAAKEMVALGFTQVVNLKGGLLAWQEARLPIVKD